MADRTSELVSKILWSYVECLLVEGVYVKILNEGEGVRMEKENQVPAVQLAVLDALRLVGVGVGHEWLASVLLVG